jgi:hypothetical protein
VYEVLFASRALSIRFGLEEEINPFLRTISVVIAEIDG